MATRFLASKGLSALRYYLPGDPSDLNLIFVPTASDLDAEPYWLDADRKALSCMGFNIRELDIKGLTYEQSCRVLDLTDVLYVAGGNTFHLLNHLQLSGFDAAIAERPELFYAGGSAGAAVAGPDIEPVATLDRPELADPPASTEGLRLVTPIVLPHYSPDRNGEQYRSIIEKYQSRFEFVTLTDSQAYVVVDGVSEVVKSTQV
jgi:dipeptidase E